MDPPAGVNGVVKARSAPGDSTLLVCANGDGHQDDTLGDMLAARHEGTMQRSAAAAQAWANIKWRDSPTRISDGAAVAVRRPHDGRKSCEEVLTARSTASSTADATCCDACTTHVDGGADERTCKRMLTVHGTNTKCVYGAFGAKFHQQLHPAPAACCTDQYFRQGWPFAGSFGSEASMMLEDAPGTADFNLTLECDHDRDTTVERRDST